MTTARPETSAPASGESASVLPAPVVIITLKFYGWLFLISGAAFMLSPRLITSLTNFAGSFFPFTAPIAGSERSFWLALTGSYMAMVSYLSFALARNPLSAAAWNCLLLAKGMSSILFLAFAVADRNLIFLGGALVDGPIFLHILYLRIRAEWGAAKSGEGCWTPRFGGAAGCGYEVWFAKFNDPKTRAALWIRYTIDLAAGVPTGACWYALFDPKEGETHQGRWEEAFISAAPGADGILARFEKSSLRRGSARAEGPKAAWNITWKESGAPPFCFVHELLYYFGIGGSVYYSPLSLGVFNGEIQLMDRHYTFENAPGSIGHIWGRKMGDNWRWAHAVLDDGSGGETAFEILSAQGRVGPVLTPYVTSAHLWHHGRHYASTGALRTLRNSTTPDGDDKWSFIADFGEFRAEGECVSPPAATVEFDYRDTNGRVLRCLNSKTGSLRLRLVRPDGGIEADLRTEDSAAVETVR